MEEVVGSIPTGSTNPPVPERPSCGQISRCARQRAVRVRTATRVRSDITLNIALRRLGYTTDDMTALELGHPARHHV